MSVHPREIDEFATQARRFLNWCEAVHAGKGADRMQREALQHLSETYVAALKLPGTDFIPAPDPPSLSKEQRINLGGNLRPLPFQYYWEVFTPTNLDDDKEPVCGDLLEDFLGVYGDLAAGLWLYDRGHVQTAVFSWLQTFGIHWGRHVVSAMHALHSFEPTDDPGSL